MRAAKIDRDIQELLVWTYQVERADVVDRAAGRGIYPGCPTNMGMIAAHAELGFSIPLERRGVGAKADMHPDAEAVHYAVCDLDPTAAGLVFQFAKRGGEPDAMVGVVPKLIDIVRPNGKLKYKRQGGEIVGVYQRWDVLPEHVDFARATYAEWHAGLVELVTVLGSMATYRATGPAAPTAPWKK